MHNKLVDFNKRIVSRQKQDAISSFLIRFKIFFLINKKLKILINFVEFNNRNIILHKFFGIYLKKVMSIIKLDSYYSSSISYLSVFFKQRIFNRLYIEAKEKLILRYFSSFLKKFRFKKNFKQLSKTIQKPFRILFRRSIRILKAYVFLKIKNFILSSCFKKIKFILKESGKFIRILKENKHINVNNINDMFSVKYSEVNLISEYTPSYKEKTEDKESKFIKNRHNTMTIKKISNEKNDFFSHPLEKKNSLSKFK